MFMKFDMESTTQVPITAVMFLPFDSSQHRCTETFPLGLWEHVVRVCATRGWQFTARLAPTCPMLAYGQVGELNRHGKAPAFQVQPTLLAMSNKLSLEQTTC